MTAQSQWFALRASHIAQINAAQPVGDEPLLALNNRGLAYGDGFFTTMGVSGGVIRWHEGHIQRIRSHARALELSIGEADIERLMAQLSEQARQVNEGMMKLIITRAPQSIRGYGYAASDAGGRWQAWLYCQSTPTSDPHTMLATLDLPDHTCVPVHTPITAICLTSQIACLPPTLAGLKTLNRLDNVLASGELQRRKLAFASASNAPFNAIKATDTSAVITAPAEGLVRDMDGHWVEGTMSNVFYQLAGAKHAGQWFTPPLHRSGVAGIMREVIITGFAKSTQPVIERHLSDVDLPRLQRLFFCNALRGIMPVDWLILDQDIKVQLAALTCLVGD